MPNLRDRGIVAAQLWDWEWLNPAFGGTKARLSDVDGITEQDRHLLMVEAKQSGFLWDRYSAQFRTLRTFSTKPGCNAIVLYGEYPEDPVVSHIEVVRPHGRQPRIPASNEDVIRYVSAWFEHTHHCQIDGECVYEFLRPPVALPPPADVTWPPVTQPGSVTLGR